MPISYSIVSIIWSIFSCYGICVCIYVEDNDVKLCYSICLEVSRNYKLRMQNKFSNCFSSEKIQAPIT